MGTQSEVSWFTQAISNRALFHGTLLLGAAFRAPKQGRTGLLPQECYYHHAETVRHIIHGLENSQESVHEGLMAAVACLAAFEVRILYRSALIPSLEPEAFLPLRSIFAKSS